MCTSKTASKPHSQATISISQFQHQPNSLQFTSEGAFITTAGENYPKFNDPNFFIVHVGDEFLVTYSCKYEYLKGVQQSASIYSRVKFPNKHNVGRIEKVLKDNKINLRLENMDQRDCRDIEYEKYGELIRSVGGLMVVDSKIGSKESLQKLREIDEHFVYMVYFRCLQSAKTYAEIDACTIRYKEDKVQFNNWMS